MATVIKIKRSETASSVPAAGDLAVGELAMNPTDQKMYTKLANGNVVVVASVTTAGTSDVVDDTSPQLGGDLDLNSSNITGTGAWQGTAIADSYISSATNWNTAHTDRLKWDGGATGLTAATGRTSLGLGALSVLATVSASQIDASAVGASELNVTGNGTTSQFLRSDADGTFTWDTPTDTNTVYTHPNHSGDIVSSGDGATTIQAGAVDIAMLSASGTASATTFLRGDNSWVVPTDTNTDTKWDGGTTGLTAATGRTSLGLGTAATAASTDFIAVSGDAMTGTLTLVSITETETTKSASFTPNLTTEGTIFDVSGTITITMPTAAAGKAFTIIDSGSGTLSWAGTIKWNGGAAPSPSGITIYSFISNGTDWYGMQAATGLA